MELPKDVVVYKGGDSTSRAMMEGDNEIPTSLAFIDPEKRTQYAFFERFICILLMEQYFQG